VNVGVILLVVPWLGYDIQFLRDTPHAHAPMSLMLPWVIVGIAAFVELNFRGFQLGRLTAWSQATLNLSPRDAQILAVVGSALTFSCDPFMVATFHHLHWIAVWDGLIWGTLWVRTRNLWIPLVAHAVEVIVMYTVLKRVFA
jgi:membrane protease YdiL (CAAX protease family)